MLSFRKGDVVHSDEPYSAVVSDSLLGSVCSCCFSEFPRNRANYNRCFGCGTVTYCSTACQLEDADDHEIECRIMSTSSEQPDEYTRLILRTAARYSRERDIGQHTIGEYFGHRRIFDDLMSHIDDIGDDDLLRHFDYAKIIRKMLRSSETHISVELVMIIILKLCINAHSIIDSDSGTGKSLGAAVYLAASIIDHTCECIDDYIQLFDGKRIYLKALRDFSVDDPLQIRTHYIALDYPYGRRQRLLLSKYYFKCKCNRCLIDAKLPGTRLLEDLESFLSMPADDSWWDAAREVFPYFSQIPVTNSYHHILLKRLRNISSGLSCFGEASAFGYMALIGAASVHEKQRILYHLSYDMARSGSNHPRSENYAIFRRIQKMTIELLEDIFHKNHPLVLSIRKLTSLKRIKSS
ncbi:SET and MYND domain-containing protein DDB_G0292140-like [Galendromus occidentalis]|uniref:SET and MYND domain-containing protein DDB_G0292140-like n=1 Tax=Galendromus occidentalis TaxID=34638 RepID=A0AAJ7PB27_9ACAR|nr:SET and MYND domain-containing protein DDB_G0292140-like [Galendromus occidentalis]